MAAPRARKKKAVRTPQEAAREAFRADLRLAAERVFAEKGFVATKMVDVARAANVAVGTLYNYFPSKETIFEELCATRSADFHARLLETGKGSAPLVRLEQLIRTCFDYLDEHGALFAVFVERGGTAEYDIERLGGGATERSHERFLRMLEVTIASAVEARELRSDIPAATLASLLSGAMNGATYAWLKRRRRGRLSEVTPDLLSLFLSGARRTP
jgi:AcrR family transcriptional regulator